MVVPRKKTPTKPINQQKKPQKTNPNMHWRVFFFRLCHNVTCNRTSFQQNVSTCYELCKLMHTINTFNYSRYHNTMHTTMANQRILPQSVEMLFPTPWATASSGAVAVEPGYPFSWHGRCPLENLAPVAVSTPIFIVIWSALLSNVKQSLAENSETQFVIVECHIHMFQSQCPYNNNSANITVVNSKSNSICEFSWNSGLNDSYQATVLHRERGTEPLGDTLRFSSLIEAECLYFYC